jgi:hypothetical protein
MELAVTAKNAPKVLDKLAPTIVYFFTSISARQFGRAADSCSHGIDRLGFVTFTA